jgi:hypothetical protein
MFGPSATAVKPDREPMTDSPSHQTMAADSMRMTPSAISARPGQFFAGSKPAPGLRGSKVSPALGEGALLPLSRALERGGAAESTNPTMINSAPSQMATMLASRQAHRAERGLSAMPSAGR